MAQTAGRQPARTSYRYRPPPLAWIHITCIAVKARYRGFRFDPRLRIHQRHDTQIGIHRLSGTRSTERGGEAGGPTEVGSRGSGRYTHTPWQTELVVGVLVPHRKDRSVFLASVILHSSTFGECVHLLSCLHSLRRDKSYRLRPRHLKFLPRGRATKKFLWVRCVSSTSRSGLRRGGAVPFGPKKGNRRRANAERSRPPERYEGKIGL